MVSQHTYEQVQHHDKVTAPPAQVVTSGGTSVNITTAVLPKSEESNQKHKKGDDVPSDITTATTRPFIICDDVEAVCCSVYDNCSDNSSDAAAVRHFYELIGILNDPEAQAKLPIVSIEDLLFVTPHERSSMFSGGNKENVFVQKRFDAVSRYVRNGHNFDETTAMKDIVDTNKADAKQVSTTSASTPCGCSASTPCGCLTIVAFVLFFSLICWA